MSPVVSTTRPDTCLRARLHHLALTSADPQTLAAFYEQALGYEIERADGLILGRARMRNLLFVQGPSKSLSFAAYAVEDAAELDRLRARIDAANWPREAFATPFFEAGALRVRDPDGNALVFGVPAERAVGGDPAAALDARMQHVVMASRDAARIAAFFSDVLGFTLSDTVVDDEGAVRTSFLRCSHEHHDFAVFQASENRLDHHCYETRDWNQIRDWGDHMAKRRIPITWGPGRHGPGDNLFIFVHDPDGNWVELSAELEVVAHDRPAGSWKHEQRTLNSWGQAPLRS